MHFLFLLKMKTENGQTKHPLRIPSLTMQIPTQLGSLDKQCTHQHT